MLTRPCRACFRQSTAAPSGREHDGRATRLEDGRQRCQRRVREASIGRSRRRAVAKRQEHSVDVEEDHARGSRHLRRPVAKKSSPVERVCFSRTLLPGAAGNSEHHRHVD
eukprot:scaffold45238_cov64-Phaeocystis_antarctica.AAC.5